MPGRLQVCKSGSPEILQVMDAWGSEGIEVLNSGSLDLWDSDAPRSPKARHPMKSGSLIVGGSWKSESLEF